MKWFYLIILLITSSCSAWVGHPYPVTHEAPYIGVSSKMEAVYCYTEKHGVPVYRTLSFVCPRQNEIESVIAYVAHDLDSDHEFLKQYKLLVVDRPVDCTNDHEPEFWCTNAQIGMIWMYGRRRKPNQWGDQMENMLTDAWTLRQKQLETLESVEWK